MNLKRAALRIVSTLHKRLDPGAFFSADASLEIDRLRELLRQAGKE